MTLVQLADIKVPHFGPQKSPWQVQCYHGWITGQLCFAWDWFRSAVQQQKKAHKYP